MIVSSNSNNPFCTLRTKILKITKVGSVVSIVNNSYKAKIEDV